MELISTDMKRTVISLLFQRPICRLGNISKGTLLEWKLENINPLSFKINKIETDAGDSGE
jgi:hypothetical protein